jgi:RNA recognition motif-containing protein
MEVKLYVGNLSYNTTEEHVRDVLPGGECFGGVD